MSTRMDEFREFVNNYPKLRNEVRNGHRTWQSIYEEWVLYGDKTDWNIYKDDSKEKEVKKSQNVTISIDTLKNIAGYIKKINPNDLNRTLNTVQKVIQIVQTVGGSKNNGIVNGVNNAYNDWWD